MAEQDGRPSGLMAGSTGVTSAPGGRLGPLFGRFLGRRRTYLVDSAYQLRSAIVAVLGMAFLLAFAAALFHLLSLETARTLAQKAPGALRGDVLDDSRSVLYLVAVGIIFVAAVFVIEILETHKTAGVVYKVTRGLRDFESGRWGVRVALRKHDNFREMEEAFNAATRSACEQIDQDLSAMQGVEGQLRVIARELESGNREGALLMLRQVAGELQNQRERKRNLLGAAVPMAPPGRELP